MATYKEQIGSIVVDKINLLLLICEFFPCLQKKVREEIAELTTLQ